LQKIGKHRKHNAKIGKYRENMLQKYQSHIVSLIVNF